MSHGQSLGGSIVLCVTGDFVLIYCHGLLIPNIQVVHTLHRQSDYVSITKV